VPGAWRSGSYSVRVVCSEPGGVAVPTVRSGCNLFFRSFRTSICDL
jgi:hypothetical protein